jgi:hypothetical protein
MKKLSISSIEKICGGEDYRVFPGPKWTCTDGVIGVIGQLFGVPGIGSQVDKGIRCIKGWFK